MAGARILTDPFLRPGLGPLERHGPLPHPGDVEGIDIVVISTGIRIISIRPPSRPSRGIRWSSCRAVSAGLSARRPAAMSPRSSKAIGWWSERSRSRRCRLAIGSRRAPPARSRSATSSRGRGASGLPATPAASTRCGRSPVGSISRCCPSGRGGLTSAPATLARGLRPTSLREVGPSAAVPIHWGTLYPRRLHRLWPGPLAEPGERFAGHAARLAPDVDVHVLRPGEGTSILLPAARPDRS